MQGTSALMSSNPNLSYVHLADKLKIRLKQIRRYAWDAHGLFLELQQVSCNTHNLYLYTLLRLCARTHEHIHVPCLWAWLASRKLLQTSFACMFVLNRRLDTGVLVMTIMITYSPTPCRGRACIKSWLQGFTYKMHIFPSIGSHKLDVCAWVLVRRRMCLCHAHMCISPTLEAGMPVLRVLCASRFQGSCSCMQNYVVGAPVTVRNILFWMMFPDAHLSAPTRGKAWRISCGLPDTWFWYKQTNAVCRTTTGCSAAHRVCKLWSIAPSKSRGNPRPTWICAKALKRILHLFNKQGMCTCAKVSNVSWEYTAVA